MFLQNDLKKNDFNPISIHVQLEFYLNMSTTNKYKLYINASELALWINQNPYENRALATLRYWRKQFPENYTLAKQEYQQSTGKEPIEYFDKKEQEIQMEKRLNTNFRKRFHKDIQSSQSADEALSKKSKLMEELVTESTQKGITLNEQDQKQLEQSIEKHLKTGFGIQKEKFALDWYESQYPSKAPLLRSSSLIKKVWFSTTLCDVYLQGKYDGMTADKQTIIEVKHRMNQCFKKMRQYEQVQVDAYHFLFDCITIELLECYRKKDNTHEYFVLHSQLSMERWKHIQTEMIAWIQLFEQLLTPHSSLRKNVFSVDSETHLSQLLST
jgi:hypothetical protein